LALAIALSAASIPEPSGAEPAARHPSQVELARLREIDPYVTYFSSLSYDGATVSGDFIRALILAESSGDTRATSPSGALGLTQILPATAKKAAERLASSGFDFLHVDERMLADLAPERLYDPALNILIASFLSATYGELYDGRFDLMAAAWNLGPDALERDRAAAVERDQTRILVGRVLGYLEYFGRAR
jgi:soluble lytic murein transglycosylase-like protein